MNEIGNSKTNDWSNPIDCRKYLDNLFIKLGYQEISDWYRVTKKDFLKNGGTWFLHIFKSHFKALMKFYPDYDWKPWLFNSVPFHYWEKKENRIKYLKWFENKKQIQEKSDWYKITTKDICKNRGVSLVLNYYPNVKNAFDELYPDETEIKPWYFNVSNGFWHKLENRIAYIDWLGQIMGYKQNSDFYNLTHASFIKNYGYGLIDYISSIIKILRECKPDYDWKEWLFYKVPTNNFWSVKENKQNYLHWLFKVLKFATTEDWYQIRLKDFEYNHGSGLINMYRNSPSECIIDNIDYNWDKTKFYKNKKMQIRLYKIIKEYFPDAIFDYNHPKMRFSRTNHPMEIDIFIPSINVGFEYQDATHFVPDYYGEESFQSCLIRDEEKRIAAPKYLRRFIEIDYRDWLGGRSYIDNLLKPILSLKEI